MIIIGDQSEDQTRVTLNCECSIVINLTEKLIQLPNSGSNDGKEVRPLLPEKKHFLPLLNGGIMRYYTGLRLGITKIYFLP